MRTVLLALMLMFAPVFAAASTPKVELLETFPAGSQITISTGATVYLRIAYDTDVPVQIWVQPYFEGKPVQAGSSPSRSYTGKGELLGWFFMMPPGGQVDEIRVTAGDGSPNGTPEVARWPIRLFAYPNAKTPGEPPAWVKRMSSENEIASRKAMQAQMDTPMSSGDFVAVQIFMLGALALVLVGFAWSIWGVWRWRGYWRLLAALPSAALVLVVLNIALGLIADSTSHNLWPFEIFMVGIVGGVMMLVLGVLRLFLRKQQGGAAASSAR